MSIQRQPDETDQTDRRQHELHTLAGEIMALDGLSLGDALHQARRQLAGLVVYAAGWDTMSVKTQQATERLSRRA
jgi:hypothetical protein